MNPDDIQGSEPIDFDASPIKNGYIGELLKAEASASEGYPWLPHVIITDPSKAVDPQSIDRWGSMMGPRIRAADE